MQIDDERLNYLARVASLYYEQGKNQQEVAREIGVSRSMVSRLLTEAREHGVVEIIVHYPCPTCPELEQQLAEVFDLRYVKVLHRGNKPYNEMLQGLGILAAEHLGTILSDGMIIGISWGAASFRATWQAPRDSGARRDRRYRPGGHRDHQLRAVQPD